MVNINRGPGVVGWDSTASLPKGVVSPSEHRMGLQALALYPGVFMDSAGSAAISTSTSSRDLTIAGARSAVAAPLGGLYYPSWRAAVTLTPAVAGSQNRIDVVAVRQQDYEVDAAQVLSQAELILVQGVASATPVQPTLGDGTLGLYAARVHAGDTTSSQYTITRLFDWTTPVGGIPHFDTEARRNALLPSPVVGQECTTGSGVGYAKWVWTGSKWSALLRQGQATIYAGWSGYCRWQQTGRMVDVEFGVSRTDGTFTRSAWGGANCADGLPKARNIQAPGQSSYCSNFAVSNASSDPGAYAIEVSSSGILWLDAWWSERSYTRGCWWAGRFTYEVADW